MPKKVFNTCIAHNICHTLYISRCAYIWCSHMCAEWLFGQKTVETCAVADYYYYGFRFTHILPAVSRHMSRQYMINDDLWMKSELRKKACQNLYVWRKKKLLTRCESEMFFGLARCNWWKQNRVNLLIDLGGTIQIMKTVREICEHNLLFPQKSMKVKGRNKSIECAVIAFQIHHPRLSPRHLFNKNDRHWLQFSFYSTRPSSGKSKSVN